MEVLNKRAEIFSITYGLLITSCLHLLFYPFTGTQYLSDSTFAATLGTYDEVKPLQLQISLLYRPNISNYQMLHTILF